MRSTAASPTDSTGDGGGFVFADAECSEDLQLVFDSTTANARGDTLSSGGSVSGTETCVYTIDTGNWHVGDISGPGTSPINGPFTATLWGDSISMTMIYHMPVELGQPERPVALIGELTDSTHVAGTWTCPGCGGADSTGARGAIGTWKMSVQR